MYEVSVDTVDGGRHTLSFEIREDYRQIAKQCAAVDRLSSKT